MVFAEAGVIGVGKGRALSKALRWASIPIVAAAGVAVFVLLRADGAQPNPASPEERIVIVRARKPEVRDLPIRLTYPAELQPIQAADIRSIEAKGFVRQIFVDKGDRVRRGQLLVTVDCPEYRARRRQAEEEVRSVRAVYLNARRVYERLKPMRAQNFISQMELDNARANHDASEARLRNAEARLSEVIQTLGYCEIRSPFTGEVSARHMDPGAQVRPGGPPILTIMRIDAVRVWVNVVEREASYVKIGLPCDLTVHGLPGKKFPGKVTRFIRGLDPRTRTLLTEIEIENPDGILKPGMFGRVALLVETRPRALLVPSSAVLTQECLTAQRQMCTWVYVVQDGRTRRVEVQVGHDTGTEIEIRKGIGPDDVVVYAGRDLVADGTPVRIIQ
jgi:RND family efflux transporter MFP subunit